MNEHENEAVEASVSNELLGCPLPERDNPTDAERDPFEVFEIWCNENGYADINAGKPEDIDLKRLDEALAKYSRY